MTYIYRYKEVYIYIFVYNINILIQKKQLYIQEYEDKLMLFGVNIDDKKILLLFWYMWLLVRVRFLEENKFIG